MAFLEKSHAWILRFGFWLCFKMGKAVLPAPAPISRSVAGGEVADVMLDRMGNSCCSHLRSLKKFAVLFL